MRVIRQWPTLPDGLRSGAVTIGNFDGVHRGHARIVERLLVLARKIGGPAVVLTFDPHPASLLCPEKSPAPLTWTERKADLLRDLGVDWLLFYPTDEALLALSPRDFFEEVVRKKLDAKALVEGPNFCFGHDRTGTIDVLRKFTAGVGMLLEVVEPYRQDSGYVSSSRIRKLLREGQACQVSKVLTQPYRIRGMVTHGAGRGVKLGFPTANLEAIDTLLPGMGVYAGRAWIFDECWPAVTNVGPSPTFGEQRQRVEVHLIGRRGFLYGEVLEVDFSARLRDIERFPTAELLRVQIRKDVQQALAAVHRLRECGE